MKIKNLNDLFLAESGDMYNAEKQLVKALPKMAKAASNPELKDAFESHLEETKNQVNRLEDVFGEVNHKVQGQTCEAMKGLVEEGSELIEDAVEPAARDAGLIAAGQKVEHYEIASYGCLVTWAKELGLKHAADLLNQNLDEEKAADKKLNTIAMNKANAEARNGHAEENEANEMDEEAETETTGAAV